MQRIKVIYFSPTGNTLSVLQYLVSILQKRWDATVDWCSYTTPQDREAFSPIQPDDFVVWGSPVYAGRLPNKLVPFIAEHLHGSGNPVLLVATFGNRAFDNCLAEMAHLSIQGGLTPVGATAMVAPHAFDNTIGQGRPNASDWKQLTDFAQHINPNRTTPLAVPGSADSNYYTPLRDDGAPARFLKASPHIDANLCTRCGKCLHRCPTGCLQTSADGLPHCDGVCIKCMACTHACPTGAVTIGDANFQSHIQMLLSHCQQPQKCAFFL